MSMIISQVNISNAKWNGMQLRDTENVQISFTTVSNAQWIYAIRPLPVCTTPL